MNQTLLNLLLKHNHHLGIAQEILILILSQSCFLCDLLLQFLDPC